MKKAIIKFFTEDDPENHWRYRRILFIGIVIAMITILAAYHFDNEKAVGIGGSVFTLLCLFISYCGYGDEDDDDDSEAEAQFAVYEDDVLSAEPELMPAEE